ncbi:hypothetical protein [Nonomuraea basaltis]|uniref:hypothetical protein n=1 Tax=Nonomuraea basaltis TaxID=2495887 RepID=UPI00110C6289|nr:hypothetical protein [Nonomuraea basaltis]TMR93953.1 hypothetical protein EJK15_36625 [Nonomuraea basaltis]
MRGPAYAAAVCGPTGAKPGPGLTSAIGHEVFDREVGLEQVPDGYRAMNDRIALKVLIRP